MQHFIEFPHIEQLRHIIHKNLIPDSPSQLDYLGTIKLHGTNIGITELSISEPLVVQSRNRILSNKIDNVNSYKWVMEREQVFRELFSIVRKKINSQDKITIYGEFAGKGIQGGVGITMFSKFFSIFHILVNGKFLPLDLYSDIYNNSNRIYNVSQFGTYKISINKSNLEEQIEYIDKLTSEIGNSCPASKFLGKDGLGEGLVWVCTNDTRPELWFKSKCEHFKLATTGKLAKEPMSKDLLDQVSFAEQFAKEYLTSARIEQAINTVGKDIRKFIQWCIDDIVREEGCSLNDEQQKLCSKYITKLASEWYKKNIGF